MMTMNPEVDDSIAITSKGLLYLHIQKLIPELDEKLFQEILDFGIETPDQFDDSYQGCWESYRPGADFAQQLMEDCGYMNPDDNPLWAFIDWDEVWEHHVRYDYTILEGTYVFRDDF
jgi:hypothetical protein